jgi:hypothetical protein
MPDFEACVRIVVTAADAAEAGEKLNKIFAWGLINGDDCDNTMLVVDVDLDPTPIVEE